MSFPQIDARRFRDMPDAMRWQGVMLMLEAGNTLAAVAEQAGVGRSDLHDILSHPPKIPLRREADFNTSHPEAGE